MYKMISHNIMQLLEILEGAVISFVMLDYMFVQDDLLQ